MKTKVLKKSEVKRKWYIVDAKDKILGRLATKIADRLRGKDRVYFTPHVDCGDFIIVTNVEKVKLTGAKMDNKMYYTHSGYLGNLKTASAKEVMGKSPKKILELAVRGMLPKNKLRKDFMKKLKLYAGESHPHEAQNPEALNIN